VGVERALDALRETAVSDGNVVPAMLDAARADATLYEIRQALEQIYGAYREPVFF
jgi:methylmalonyl-CoA mutase N-terminal domain/subunit